MPTLLLYGFMALAILGAVGGFVYKERQAGYDKAEALYKPKLTACQTQVNVMGGQIKEQNAAVEAERAAVAKKQQEAATALKAAEGKAKVWQDNAVRLQGVLANRQASGPKDCKSAWSEIRKPQ